MESSLRLLAALLLSLVPAIIVTAQTSADEIVQAHNDVRALVGVEPVSWDPVVAAYAQEYANQRTDCQLEYSQNSPYGENLFRASGAWKAVDAILFWASAKQYYDHTTNMCSAPADQTCHHYLQVVYRDTKAIGCGIVGCDGTTDGFLFVCSYSPPLVPGQIPY